MQTAPAIRMILIENPEAAPRKKCRRSMSVSKWLRRRPLSGFFYGRNFFDVKIAGGTGAGQELYRENRLTVDRKIHQ